MAGLFSLPGAGLGGSGTKIAHSFLVSQHDCCRERLVSATLDNHDLPGDNDRHKHARRTSRPRFFAGGPAMTGSISDSPVYEVFALRYASHYGRKSAANFLGEDPLHGSEMPLDFFVWLIRGEGRTILVDTGFTPETAVRRGRHYHAHPVDLLGRLGVAAHDVSDVIVTHLHYDHAGNISAFPGARIHLQTTEMQFCTGGSMRHPELRKNYEVADVAAAVQTLYEGRLHFVDGEEEIAPGISVHLCGGHTQGLQFVTVATARGEIVLASDALHYYENIRRGVPYPSFVDLAEYLDAYQRIAARAQDLDRIIPGHDPLALTAFPRSPASPDIAMVHASPVTRLAFEDARADAANV
ncbi:N-acyl homoserine lactonase family protein [Amycolatopsis silviterrae]|uniref:N-acyl homoserine lactonase family protein n=1 Tax=Amycolatopsis silviterrae TaxID=1656914 RepID=A0ABW5HD76_9PSEU